jgi:hypothetical protein
LPYSSPGRCTAREYLDFEDFAGPLRRLFDGAMAFIQRNLRKAQAGRGVNAPGICPTTSRWSTSAPATPTSAILNDK